MSFIRTQENFVCEHCGNNVVGTGYTNHCPKCLWSKHVDIDPGDRQANCHGAMKPIKIIFAGRGRWRILHHCQICGHEKMNDVQNNDDWEAVIAIQKNTAK